MSETFEYDVFLSHSSKDKPVVRPLAERLRKDGLRVWFDEWEIKPGDNIPSKIEDGLERSRVLVLCMSVNAFGSDWAMLESQTYRFRDPLNKELRFIPLRLDGTKIKGSLAQFLYVNWAPESRNKEYAKLFEACHSFEAASVTNSRRQIEGWVVATPDDVVIDRNARDDFLTKIKDILARRVGMRCSNSACQKLTSGPRVDPGKALNIGIAAHITAASAGGPRYDASLSREERASIDNGVWLCQNCAKLVDNDEERYTAQLLRIWKKNAEDFALRQLETAAAPIVIDKVVSVLRGNAGNESITHSILDKSPFHPFGAMAVGVRSYITRICDLEFKKAIEDHDFIWLEGDFQFGKTSLLRRHEVWLEREWIRVCPDLELCDHSTNGKFWQDFFAEIDEATKECQHNITLGRKFDWRALKVLVQKHRIAFLLDEIGTCSDSQIQQLFENLYSLAEKVPGHIKLIVGFMDSPGRFLTKCGIRNPKHTAAWKIICLGSFTQDEVVRLIELFPTNVSSVLRAQIDRLESLTDFKPQRMQCLLHNLWETLGLSEAPCADPDSLIDAWFSEEENR